MKKLLSTAGVSIIITIAVVLVLVAACAQPATPTTTTTTTSAAPTTSAATTTTTTSAATTTTKTATTPAAAETRVLRLAFHDFKVGTMENALGRPGGDLQRTLYEMSGGRLNIGPVTEMFATHPEKVEAVATGKVDVANYSVKNLYASYPVYDWAEVPGLLSSDGLEAQRQQARVDTDPAVLELLRKWYREDLGVWFWFNIRTGPSNALFSTTKKVASPDDLKGYKMGLSGTLEEYKYSLLGAQAVTVQDAERTSSMMTGILDGIRTGVNTGLTSYGLSFVKYCTLLPVPPEYMSSYLINAKVYDSLPPDLQEVLKEVGRLMTLEAYVSSHTQIQFYSAQLKGAGVEEVNFTPEGIAKWNETIKPVEQQYLKDTGDRGKQLLAVIRDIIAKYNAFNKNP